MRSDAARRTGGSYERGLRLRRAERRPYLTELTSDAPRRNLLVFALNLRFAPGVSSQLGSSRTILLVVLGLAILGVLAVVGREIYRSLHPRSKPMRKRKRRTF